MVQRIALGLEYHGGPFQGWQKQDPPAATIQQHLEIALSRVADQPIATVCAGRTDAGVHATQQVLHFDTTALRAERDWVGGCNANLPPTIRALWAKAVPDDFDARRKALARRYRYVIHNQPIRSALGHALWSSHYRPLCAWRMHQAAQLWLGEHDFSSFRASECQSHSPVRTLHEITVSRVEGWVFVELQANAFLHHMVRNMVGVLLCIGEKKQELNWAATVLQARCRKQAAVTAPADGLYLVAVYYPPHYDVPSSKSVPWFLGRFDK